MTLERTSEATLYEAPLGDANYGVGERIQLKLEIPLLVERGPGTRVGLGKPVLGVKWRFLQDSSSGLALSTYPQLEFRSPVVPLRDAEDDRNALLLPIELAMGWGIFSVNGEAGYRIGRREDDEFIYGLAMGYELTRTLELLSECNGHLERSGQTSELLCQLGAQEEIGQHFSLLGALGTTVAGNQAERRQLNMYFGLQSRW